MALRIKKINRKLQEHRPLDHRRQPAIQLRWERDQNTRPIQPARIRLPPLPASLIPLLRSGPLLQRQPGHEHQQHSEEEGPHDAAVLSVEGRRSARDGSVRGGGDGDHEDAKLHDDLAEVVRMVTLLEEADVTHGPIFVLTMAHPKLELLLVAYALHHEPNYLPTVPMMSCPVLNVGCGWYRVTVGELRTVTGNETVQTHSIWKIQREKKGKNLSRLSLKRVSVPVLRMW
jgi:hypothetical protein